MLACCKNSNFNNSLSYTFNFQLSLDRNGQGQFLAIMPYNTTEHFFGVCVCECYGETIVDVIEGLLDIMEGLLWTLWREGLLWTLV